MRAEQTAEGVGDDGDWLEVVDDDVLVELLDEGARMGPVALGPAGSPAKPAIWMRWRR